MEEIKKVLNKERVQGILVSSHANIVHLTSYANFSLEEREAWVLVTPEAQYIFTDGRYAEAVLKHVPEFELVLISGEKPFLKSLEELLRKHGIESLGVEEDDLKVLEYKKLRKVVKKLKHVDIKRSRAVKSLEEIKLIERACGFGDEVFSYITSKVLREGISEKEVAVELEGFLKKKGVEISFKPIVAFGANSSVPHHENSEKKLAAGFVLLDLGAKYKNYCSDMTRTLFWGKATEEQKNIYESVLGAQERAVEFIDSRVRGNDTILASEVDRVARDYIVAQGFGSIPHSLGHGIGVQVHEHPFISPKSKEILKMGMVFSIEPGIYIPGFGGVRIEDLYVLEKNGIRQLTKSDKSLIVLGQ